MTQFERTLVFMGIVFEQVAILFIFALIGYLLSHFGVIDSKQSKLLSVLGVYVFLPCKVIKSFWQYFNTQYISEKYPFIIVSAIIVVCLVIVAHFLCRLFSKDSYERNIYNYSLIVPNFGYVGYALAESLFGGEALLNMIIFGLPISCYTYTEGFRILTGQDRVSLKKMINPMIIAVVLGAILGLSGSGMPSIVEKVLSMGGSCMSPIAMILVGVVVSEFSITRILSDWRNYVMSGLRLAVIPLIIVLAMIPFCSREMILSAVLCFAMPCGMNTVVFPKLVGKNCELGAGLAFVSGVLSLVTLTFWLNLIR